MRLEDLELQLRLGHETPALEFKPPGKTSDVYLKAVVARACMAMANQRAGGTVVVGVSESSDHRLTPVGVTAKDLLGWVFDPVAGWINSCCEPAIQFELTHLEDKPNSRVYVVMEVTEFAEYPIVCTKNFSVKDEKILLRQGAIYVRSRTRPASVELTSQAEMRTLIDLAVEKQIPRIARLFSALPPREGATDKAAEDLFEAERKKMLK
jgi:hypothetical protein